VRVAVLGITAAGIALTLTAASVVFFAEMFWTPGSLLQAEDRAHRIGQLRDVRVFYFFAEDSVDELLWPLVRKKMKLFGEFVEGRSTADIQAAVKPSKLPTDAASAASRGRGLLRRLGGGSLPQHSDRVERAEKQAVVTASAETAFLSVDDDDDDDDEEEDEERQDADVAQLIGDVDAFDGMSACLLFITLFVCLLVSFFSFGVGTTYNCSCHY
jgi:hypothetical protein